MRRVRSLLVIRFQVTRGCEVVTDGGAVSSSEQRTQTAMTEATVAHKMEPRVSLGERAYGAIMKAMFGLEEPLRHSTLEPALRELVKTRASQLNGCAYCID